MCLIRIKIAEPSLIALDCETGNISDCDVNELPSVPDDCRGVFSLIFSDVQTTCGSYCTSSKNRNRRDQYNIVKSGWTLAINMDQNHGSDSSGDHENYLNFFEFEKNIHTIAKDLSGDEYTECKKKAVYVRSREEHKPWFAYSAEYTFLFSKNKKYHHANKIQFKHFPSYSKTFRPDYG